jgi:hypothetical protein
LSSYPVESRTFLISIANIKNDDGVIAAVAKAL